VLLNAANGKTVARTETIPAADQAQGYAGGGIWSAPAYDPATGYAYIGASNPYSKDREHPYTNALLKIDVDPRRPTFGTIVGSYKGNVDQYDETLQALSQSPACVASQDAPDPFDDPVCGQLDLDFGAAPNLFRAGGRTLIGGLQKAGVYHAADASTMAPAWHTIVGGPCLVCNAASTAAGPNGVYGVGAPGGVAFGLEPANGTSQWSMPLGGGAHYESISTADGVVYTFDTEGFLDVLDAATGRPLTRRQMAADTGEPMVSLTSAGVAIARHTVFAAANGSSNGYLIAYQPAP
jgi:polyvinyl alcohol dehydrogenase (cytochrome)